MLLITWLDVERAFREVTHGFTFLPEYIKRIACYIDGAEIYVPNSACECDLRAWLSEIFGRYLSEKEYKLDMSINGAEYPLDIILEPDSYKLPLYQYPLWHDLTYLNNDISLEMSPPKSLAAMRMAAFHSFKGGVGRTTALITHLSAYIEQAGKQKTKVLIIDADLEAPGITYWLDSVNQPNVSFVRFLESVHNPAISEESSINFFADELRKCSLTINGVHEIFVLPACVNPANPIELLDTPILPEHLTRNTKNPWRIGDVISKLAEVLGAELVLMDLRAGISELASPILFDPRIEKFIVSTVANQSVNGAALVLEKMTLLRGLMCDSENPASVPTVILSLLTSNLRESVDYEEAILKLNAAYPGFEDKDNLSSGIEFNEAGFNENLMCINDLKQAIEITKNSSLFVQARRWAETFHYENEITSYTSSSVLISHDKNDAGKLAELCDKYIYAEKGECENLLVTEPLRNLARHYEKSIPLAVSIGAKGAGKTFNFLQLCREQYWDSFLRKLGVDPVTTNETFQETLVFPFLSSNNLNPTAKNIVEACRANCFDNLGLEKNYSEISLRDRIDNGLLNDGLSWTDFWLAELLKVFSIQWNDLKEFSGFLSSKNRRLIILIDGLEDQFPDVDSNQQQQKALEALLKIPDRFSELRAGNLGIIAFVRSDYVRSVIRQNSSQFEARYKPFALQWNAESFLRLAYWICAESGLDLASKDDSDKLSTDELLEQLHKLWGKKLGSPNSKEAYAARWIFAAICDLNGRLQARDLVRFLHHAAKRSQSDKQLKWVDRVLTPSSIRRAVEDCSNEKVKEAREEIKVLDQWINSLKDVLDEVKFVPFSAVSVKLEPDMSVLLQNLGVIFEDKDIKDDKRFYLPESYRTGLGFQLTAAARPKVLALIQRNSVKLPF